MRTRNWMAATLSVSLGLGALAGCGGSPAPTSPAPRAATAPTFNGPAAATNAQVKPGSGTTNVQAPVPPIAAQEGGTTPAAPAAGAVGAGEQPAAAPAAGTTPVVSTTTGETVVTTPVTSVGTSILPVAIPGPLGTMGLVTFQSDRASGRNDWREWEGHRDGSRARGGKDDDKGGHHGRDKFRSNFDIYVFDANAATVLALPGLNTDANETNPRMSPNGEWLVYQTDENVDFDIQLYSLRSQLINTLNMLNTDDDEEQPDVSDDGTMIVYVHGPYREHIFWGGHGGGKGDDDKKGGDFGGRGDDDKKDGDFGGRGDDDWDGKGKHKGPDIIQTPDSARSRFFERRDEELMIYSMLDGNNYALPVANEGLWDVNWPTISGSGEVVAYGASDGSSADVFVYSLLTNAQLTPPFINTEEGEYNPDLNLTGDVILFVSDRRGSEDIFAVDMRSGFVDNMSLANTEWCEQEPRWIAGVPDAIVFQSDRTGNFNIFAYSMSTAILNTLPLANWFGSDTQLRDTTPAIDEECVGCERQHGHGDFDGRGDDDKK